MRLMCRGGGFFVADRKAVSCKVSVSKGVLIYSSWQNTQISSFLCCSVAQRSSNNFIFAKEVGTQSVIIRHPGSVSPFPYIHVRKLLVSYEIVRTSRCLRKAQYRTYLCILSDNKPYAPLMSETYMANSNAPLTVKK